MIQCLPKVSPVIVGVVAGDKAAVADGQEWRRVVDDELEGLVNNRDVDGNGRRHLRSTLISSLQMEKHGHTGLHGSNTCNM